MFVSEVRGLERGWGLDVPAMFRLGVRVRDGVRVGDGFRVRIAFSLGMGWTLHNLVRVCLKKRLAGAEKM